MSEPMEAAGHRDYESGVEATVNVRSLGATPAVSTRHP
jgi:hypothetical protein